MIIWCSNCDKCFDDEFRGTDCPHDTFLANDGQNNFAHYSDSWLADHEPKRGLGCPNFRAGGQSEHDKYQEWYNKNKVSTNG